MGRWPISFYWPPARWPINFYWPPAPVAHKAYLIKKLAFKLSNGMSLPSWAEILVYVLKTYGFDPLTLFKSLGNQDVEIIIKILESQGLQTLSSIFVDILKVNLLFQKDANITGQP